MYIKPFVICCYYKSEIMTYQSSIRMYTKEKVVTQCRTHRSIKRQARKKREKEKYIKEYIFTCFKKNGFRVLSESYGFRRLHGSFPRQGLLLYNEEEQSAVSQAGNLSLPTTDHPPPKWNVSHSYVIQMFKKAGPWVGMF